MQGTPFTKGGDVVPLANEPRSRLAGKWGRIALVVSLGVVGGSGSGARRSSAVGGSAGAGARAWSDSGRWRGRWCGSSRWVEKDQGGGPGSIRQPGAGRAEREVRPQGQKAPESLALNGGASVREVRRRWFAEDEAKLRSGGWYVDGASVSIRHGTTPGRSGAEGLGNVLLRGPVCLWAGLWRVSVTALPSDLTAFGPPRQSPSPVPWLGQGCGLLV